MGYTLNARRVKVTEINSDGSEGETTFHVLAQTEIETAITPACSTLKQLDAEVQQADSILDYVQSKTEDLVAVEEDPTTHDNYVGTISYEDDDFDPDGDEDDEEWGDDADEESDEWDPDQEDEDEDDEADLGTPDAC